MGVVCSSLRGTRSGGHRYPKLGWPLVPRPLGVEILVLCASDPISARPAGAARVQRGPDGASRRLRRRGRLSGVVKAAAGTRLPGQGPWGRARQSQGIPTPLHGPCAVAGPPALASRAGCARAHCARAQGLQLTPGSGLLCQVRDVWDSGTWCLCVCDCHVLTRCPLAGACCFSSDVSV